MIRIVKPTRAMVLVILLLLSYCTTAAAQQAAVGRSAKTLKISEENAALLNRLNDYPNLEVLSITCVESLKSLPESIGSLTKLRELNMDNGNGCSMNPALPESIGNLRALQKLVLYGAQDPGDSDRKGPQPSVRQKFPKSMSELKSLTYLDLGRNGLEEVPDFVKDLPRLGELRFAWNTKIKPLPTFLTQLTELQILALDSDGLTDLPDFLNQLPKLTKITLGDNCKITQSPAKRRALKRRFPHVVFDFEDEYDCPPLSVTKARTKSR